jgi:alkylation response protein AidB-like acyl-CoA dehydrogenase
MERQQFNKPIGSFGLVASKLAEMAIGIFVGESMGYRTTGLIDDRFAASATESARVDAIEEFAVEASIIKVFGSEVLDYCADECVQIHGGYGFIEGICLAGNLPLTGCSVHVARRDERRAHRRAGKGECGVACGP